MNIQIATLQDIPKLTPALLELRPHLIPEEIEERFSLQQQEGYQIIYIGDDQKGFATHFRGH